jgi:hypothetical protein
VNVCPIPAKYASVDADLRFAMALLFLVSATMKVTETTAIQAYMHANGVPGMLVWPAACFECARRPLPIPRLSGQPGGGLAGWVVSADSADLS